MSSHCVIAVTISKVSIQTGAFNDRHWIIAVWPLRIDVLCNAPILPAQANQRQRGSEGEVY
jgi:hypothetical protein